MARLLNTLLGRLVLGALAIQLLLAPLLFQGVLRVVRSLETELFVNDVRAYARYLGDLLEFELPHASDADLVNLIDSIVLSHESTYAELHGPSLSLRSSLIGDDTPPYAEDFAFGDHGDHTYFLSIPLNDPARRGIVLRVGFDERPIEDSLAGARARVFWTLVGFVALSLVLAVVLSGVLIRPLRDLRRASRAVASGNYDEHFDATGRVMEIRDLALDLEDMRDKLVRANQRLMSEAAERVAAEKARAALERKLRHAERVETVGTLAGGIAHEFNNLLVPIKLYTELVLEQMPPAEQSREMLQRVLAAVGRAKVLVQKILTFGRQSQPEKYESIDLVAVVTDALNLAKDLFPATIRFEENLAAAGARVVGDAVQLHQLAMNLLNNAYQAIGPAGGTIAVEIAKRTISPGGEPPRTNLAQGEYVVLTVRDTGHGVDPLVRERIFEPFFTTRAPGSGSGLGLSVAHGIAASHGGAIVVQSEVGRGSTFSLYLPDVKKPDARLAALGLTNILYVAGAAAEVEHRVAAAAIGARVRTVSTTTELLSLLELERDVDALLLDLDVGEFWSTLHPDDLPRRRSTDGCMVVLGAVTPEWETALDSWPLASRLTTPVDATTISTAVQAILARRPQKTQETADDPSTGDRRRAGRL